MATDPERNPLEVMLENLTPEQKTAVNEIAKEKDISPIQALLVKIERENEESKVDKEHDHAP